MSEVGFTDLSTPLLLEDQETKYSGSTCRYKLYCDSDERGECKENFSVSEDVTQASSIAHCYTVKLQKETPNDDQREEEIDSDEEKFYFQPSFYAGSNFLQIFDESGNDISESELYFSICDEESKESGCLNIVYECKIMLFNWSTSAVVAYYIQDYIKNSKGISSHWGLILPMQNKLISFTYYKNWENINFPSIISIKGLPWSEKQINESNISEFEGQIEKIFHSENIQLLFTIASLPINLLYNSKTDIEMEKPKMFSYSDKINWKRKIDL